MHLLPLSAVHVERGWGESMEETIEIYMLIYVPQKNPYHCDAKIQTHLKQTVLLASLL